MNFEANTPKPGNRRTPQTARSGERGMLSPNRDRLLESEVLHSRLIVIDTYQTK